jgi:hypothetical protein
VIINVDFAMSDDMSAKGQKLKGSAANVVRFTAESGHRANANGADFWSTPWPNQTGG